MKAPQRVSFRRSSLGVGALQPLTLEKKDADPRCGVQVISLADGSVAHWIRFDGAIQEFFDVCLLPGVKDALTIGPQTAEFNSFISIEPGLPPPENAEALADTEKPDVKVGAEEAEPKPKTASTAPAKPTKANAPADAPKPKVKAVTQKAPAKPQRDPAKI